MGAVKKRLATEIGVLEAIRVYRQILHTVVPPLATDTRWHCTLAVTPDVDAANPSLWPWHRNMDLNVDCLPQGQGDLGIRMARAIRNAPPGPVVIIGTDIPAIRPRHIDQAFHALGGHDAVFGPANDGGYWLVGVNARGRRRDLFRDVRWSTEHALADTVQNLGTSPIIATLETLEDIDNAAALKRWRDPR